MEKTTTNQLWSYIIIFNCKHRSCDGETINKRLRLCVASKRARDGGGERSLERRGKLTRRGTGC